MQNKNLHLFIVYFVIVFGSKIIKTKRQQPKTNIAKTAISTQPHFAVAPILVIKQQFPAFCLPNPARCLPTLAYTHILAAFKPQTTTFCTFNTQNCIQTTP
jgi:hypothetical protein